MYTMKAVFSALFVLAFLLSTTGPVRAQEASPLTAREIQEGWLSLFDGKTTFGWRAPDGSKWTIYKGMLAPAEGKTGLLVTTTAFRNYELRVQYQARASAKVEVLLGCDVQGKKRTPVSLYTAGGGWWEFKVSVRDGKHGDFEFSRGLMGVAGSASDTSLPQKIGHIGLEGAGFVVRSIKLRPLGMKSLFNGKDLTGWKVFPGRKSRFTVTEEGALNIQNGPGDIQTKEQWADFLLQLECISNGKHLNSGVFFRCLPDQYQQGYEAQIRNEFTDKASQTYTLTEYDPETHKEVGKKKVMSPAVDYGTGAIYRRQPARFGVSKDNEWFTLTVLAHGNHLATWVNGIQVADWTDHRPRNNNPRQGCKVNAGAISFQGHDPTTNLSFRNIRIQDLRGGK
jgi:hypothetical protein